MKPLLLALPGNQHLEERIRPALGADAWELTVRRFPDGESYVRLDTSREGRAVVVLASMDRPDPKILPLLLVLETTRELGATSVGLVAPYLCYLRQDHRFREGDASVVPPARTRAGLRCFPGVRDRIGSILEDD